MTGDKDIFRNDFIMFLQRHNFLYEERCDGVFIFPEYGVAILLVFLADFCDLTQIEDEVYLKKREIGRKLALNYDVLYLYEDRWFYKKESVQKRILARLGSFVSIFARKCRIIKDAEIKADSRKNIQIKQFLLENHSYGDARCKYRYALEYSGRIVAVATFSASRPMPRGVCGQKESIVFDSYEWVRYASLPEYRVIGGMGRLFKAFWSDILSRRQALNRPVEVMTYSDTEWSSGEVYEKLGFEFVQERESVEFFVDTATFERVATNKDTTNRDAMTESHASSNVVKIKNVGSKKYLFQDTSPLKD